MSRARRHAAERTRSSPLLTVVRSFRARNNAPCVWAPRALGAMPSPAPRSDPPHQSPARDGVAGGDGGNDPQRTLPRGEADAGSAASPAVKKVRWTEQATRQLLEQLSTSSSIYHVLKAKNKNKQLGKEYVRFAEALKRAHKPAVLFTGPKVGAKIESLGSSWRSVHEAVAKLRNRGAATDDVEDKRCTHMTFFSRC